MKAAQKDEEASQILSHVAFGLLKDADIDFKLDVDERFSPELLQALHSIYGSVLVRATELLENGCFKEYRTPGGIRKLLKVGSRKEEYTLFVDLNFCHCPAFKYQVLHARSALTCKHVLAAKLAQITGVTKVETITNHQMRDILNDRYEQDNE